MPSKGQSSSAFSKASCTTSSARSRRRGPKIRVSVDTILSGLMPEQVIYG